MKTCKNCSLEKRAIEFRGKRFKLKSGRNKLYRAKVCKLCYNKMSIKYNRTHKEKVNRNSKKYYINYRKETIERTIKYKKLNPWITIHDAINQRCNNSNSSGYRWYGKKGIRNHLSVNDVKFLYLRDKAKEMKRPSIDRIDSQKNYFIINCRFIELSDNTKRRYQTK